jgi:hypothetical protein
MFHGARGIAKGFACGLAVIVLMALTGCWDEKPRPLVHYTPGVYTGKPDTPVSAKALEEARLRAMRQAGLAASMPGGRAAASSSSVRPPGGEVIWPRPTDSGLSRSALESQRTRIQRSTGQ